LKRLVNFHHGLPVSGSIKNADGRAFDHVSERLESGTSDGAREAMCEWQGWTNIEQEMANMLLIAKGCTHVICSIAVTQTYACAANRDTFQIGGAPDGDRRRKEG
jgi:hypothetical protein